MDPVKLEKSWKIALAEEFSKDYFGNIAQFVRQEKINGKLIYPPGAKIFSAMNSTPLGEVKVVIIGQDPYHGPGQANGLCFSVNPGVKIPPSLRNIYKELAQDTGCPIPAHGDLSSWAGQGVLLLNAMLSVRANEAGSHSKIGWQNFTDAIIKKVSEAQESVVFILWGSFAQGKQELIDESKHLILKSVHPSPLSASRGFFGNHHFSKTNAWLESKGVSGINWAIK